MRLAKAAKGIKRFGKKIGQVYRAGKKLYEKDKVFKGIVDSGVDIAKQAATTYLTGGASAASGGAPSE
jgi:hypothetical protein